MTDDKRPRDAWQEDWDRAFAGKRRREDKRLRDAGLSGDLGALRHENAARRAMDHRLVQQPAPERPNVEALVRAARGRPTEPEGAEAALGRFLANWRGRKAAGPDGVFARADLWHSVANVPVELLREAGFPWPKMAGKALLVLVPLGMFCAALALAAVVAWLVLVLV